jgi:hypothetical protein
MSSSDQEDRARECQIADNEADRQMVGAARVSIWAIAVAAIVGVYLRRPCVDVAEPLSGILNRIAGLTSPRPALRDLIRKK